MTQELKNLIIQLETRVRQLIMQQEELRGEQDELRSLLKKKEEEINKLQAETKNSNNNTAV